MSSQSKSCALDPLPEILPFITDMCNTSLRQVMLPLSQCHAIVTPRLKKANADPTDSRNYQPISNLTFTSKLVERLVCRQLVAFLKREGLLPTYQSAYRRHQSTETAVRKLFLTHCWRQIVVMWLCLAYSICQLPLTRSIMPSSSIVSAQHSESLGQSFLGLTHSLVCEGRLSSLMEQSQLDQCLIVVFHRAAYWALCSSYFTLPMLLPTLHCRCH